MALLLVVCAIVPPASADETARDRVHVTTARLDLVFALDGASAVGWRVCHPSCGQADAGSGTSVRLTDAADPPQARLSLRGPGPPVDLQALRFTAERSEHERARLVTFRAELPGGAVRLVRAYEVSREGYEVVMTVRLEGPGAASLTAGRRLEVRLEPGRGLHPPPAPGFSAMFERVSPVVIGDGTVRSGAGDGRDQPVVLTAGDWAGVRSRFWALLVRPGGPGSLEPGPGGHLALLAGEASEKLTWRYAFYSGPVESHALAGADSRLRGLLFSGLWSWLRALSFGLLSLLRGLTLVTGHPGLAIIALAIAVKLLLLPLAVVAERLQERVNATQARLQPGIEAIKAVHRGEERARRMLALYREAGVHPLYPLQSLLGVLIQLPVFIGVFDMLAEDFDLYRAPFLWVRDLSRPDALWALPFCVPFFGCTLNALPFMMSGVSLAALLRFRSAVLTPSLARRQRRNLMGMTALFFLLFYTFPAGMVLYWTSTNAVQLASQELKHRLRRVSKSGLDRRP